MKTKIFKYSFIIFSLIVFSCENIIDVRPRSSINEQIYWQNEGDFAPYMNGIYARYRSHYDYMGFGEDRSEMWVQGYNPRFSPFQGHNITAGNTVDWTAYYGTIGHINLLLEKIEPFSFVSNQDKNRIMAEAHSMRAAIYFLLAKVWGDVPLVLEAVKDENAPLYPRTPVLNVFEQINNDIQQAINLFPENNYRNKYRWSKPAVYALLADVKMWSAAVLGGGATDFNAAIAAIEEVESSGVILLENFGDIFDNRRNDEIIFSIYLNRQEFTSGRYNEGFLGTDKNVQADNISQLLVSNVGQSGYNVSQRGIELIETYSPEDLRISRTIIPQLFEGEAQRTWPYKFHGTVYSDTRIADSDFIVYRLADMLLLKAEAYAALNQPENALTYLNKVRERANVPAFTETNKALLQKEILYERGRELFHEIKRWFDLVRNHNMGVIDVYEFVPNLQGKSTPIYWPVHTNLLARNKELVQTDGY